MKKLLILLLFSIVFSSHAQELPEITPLSPEASAFKKYGDTPINMFVGAPDINIPIHTVQTRGLTVPISLTYDATGILVNQVSTTVGLGWNLNFGGMISRKVNGLPDQSPGNNYTKIELTNEKFFTS